MNVDMEKRVIAERATEWLHKLEGASSDERAEFWRWLIESPEHVRAMLDAKMLDVILAAFLRQHPLDIGDLEQRVTNVLQLLDRDGETTAPRRDAPKGTAVISAQPWYKFAATAIVAIVLGIAVLVMRPSADGRIETAAGEWKTIKLADGSELRVGPRTQLTVDFSPHERIVQLDRGELLIRVAKDATRPLFVESDLAVARAVGTVFAVGKHDPELTSITVKEGVVAVSRLSHGELLPSSKAADPVTLRAGQQLKVSALPLPVHDVNLDKELAWATGRLIFDTEQVSEAILEFNFRNELQLKLLNTDLARRPIRGAFAADDPMSFARALEAQGVVSVVRTNVHTLLLVPRLNSPNRVHRTP
jgi:transmembrane sensor